MPLKKSFTTLYDYRHLCPVCGEILALRYSSPICDALAADWQLTDQQRRFFCFREGCCCTACGSSARRMHFAKVFMEAINLKYGDSIQFLRDVAASQALEQIKIAEINNCGNLHAYFSQFPGLSYSEYGSKAPNVPSEDLMALGYADAVFDIVLTSDVLEHVPDVQRALAEVKRVLKDDGCFIFTVPWLDDRQTVIRATMTAHGEITHLKPPSFHGDYASQMSDHLVFYEFGDDFIDVLSSYFATDIYCHEGFGGVVPSVFLCRKG